MKKYLLVLVFSTTFLLSALEAVAGIWMNTGSLNIARNFHTATLLPNGKILVAGGYSATAVLNSAELYDPIVGTWTNTGLLNVPRGMHTATLLPDGRILIAGGSCNDFLKNAELYDPAVGTWTNTGSMRTKRNRHTATLLPNGKVLVVGGLTGVGGSTSDNLSIPVEPWPERSAELYDPATGTWTYIGLLNVGRYSHTATLLPNGKILVVGGDSYNGSLFSAEIYDPATGTWTITGSMSTKRSGHTATLLTDGRVLVTGGGISVEIYDPATGTWKLTGSMNIARDGHTATLLLNGQVLVAGGSGSNSAELYDPTTGTWTITGSLNSAWRYYHSATLLPNGKVLVATGGEYPKGFLTSAELYNSDVTPLLGIVSKTGTTSNIITFSASDFSNSFIDPDGYGLKKIKITSLPDCYGSLKLLNEEVKEGDEIPTNYLDNLTFVPDPNWKSETITFNWNGSNGKLYALRDGEVSITITDNSWWKPWIGGGAIGAATAVGTGYITYKVNKYCHRHDDHNRLLKEVDTEILEAMSGSE